MVNKTEEVKANVMKVYNKKEELSKVLEHDVLESKQEAHIETERILKNLTNPMKEQNQKKAFK